ncbi:MAG: peptidylprolyl isomerase [Paracoccaceae bacterium]|nr:peptidylprolyl isomerase [Paracoccaceae bacterium]
MPILTKYLMAAAITITSTSLFAQQNITADTVIATVDGSEITLGHMIIVRERLPEQYQSFPDDQLFEGILEQLIQQTILATIDDGPDSMRTQFTLENDRRLMRASDAVEAISAVAVTEGAVQAAYQEQYGGSELGSEFNASHILVETEESALNIITRAKEGADFGELAKEFSTGPSGPGGGQLGWFGTGMMVPPFEEAVATMEKGQVSGPVKTNFGWHVIKLNDLRSLSTPDLESVRQEISAKLQRGAVEEKVAEIQSSADITRVDTTEIDPAVLKDPTLLSQ